MLQWIGSIVPERLVTLASLKERSCQREIMDDPCLAPAPHVQALRGLARINWISASDRILWKPLRELAEQQRRPLRVLDVATGGGDVPIRLWRRAQRAGLKLDIHGGDISPTALELARQNAAQAQADVTFFKLDVKNDGLPQGFDVLTCSLFLHHLGDAEAPALLRQLRDAAGRMVLVNDLRRCRLGLALAWLACRLLTTSAVARLDGPRSVRAAFTLPEVRDLANQAGMASATISRRWPCRYLLDWRRP
jgi:2-polyprenyl-3-methyl-5-hydroxy-6-metoxy-1,4-benzoquinol methylase